MVPSRRVAGPEASASQDDSPIVFRDSGALRRHTLNWLSQLASRRSVFPLSAGGTSRMPRVHRAAWRVFWNKLRVFRWFARVDSAGRSSTRHLEEMATRLSSDPTFANLWRTEGLGYYTAMTALGREGGMEGLLPRDRSLPVNCLVPFYLGLGMGFSMNALQTMPKPADNSQLHDVLAGLNELCRDHAVPGFPRLIFEPLGFIAVNHYGPLIPRIDELVSQLDVELTDYFWHGIGRGLYFHPESFLPYRNLGWNALDSARRLAPDQQKRAGCLAGVAFAATLVNIRHPRHLDFVLAACENESEEADALASGVQAAMVAWLCWSERRKYIDAFAESPAHTEIVPTDQWRRLVSEPSRRALMDEHPRIVRSGDFPNLFRYRRSLPG